jgi:hypothetical protein
MDLMYLSILDLLGSFISESRTSTSSSSQASMDLSTCTHPIHSHPTYVRTLYIESPCTCMHPIHSQPVYVHIVFIDNPRTCTYPIHRQPAYASKNRVFCIRCNSENFSINPSCYLIYSPLQMFPQVFTIRFTQEYIYIKYLQVCP